MNLMGMIKNLKHPFDLNRDLAFDMVKPTENPKG